MIQHQKTYITSREDWEVVGLVIWRYRITTSRAAASSDRADETHGAGGQPTRPHVARALAAQSGVPPAAPARTASGRAEGG
jgi:hypothetical protein